MLRRFFHMLVLLCWAATGNAQPPPIGQWRDHLPWSSAIRVINTQNQLWCATSLALYTIDKADNTIRSWTKIHGLPATGIRDIAWSPEQNSLVVAHTNGTIALLTGTNIDVIDAWQNSTLTGDKTIYRLIAHKGWAYLATGLGMVITDIQKKSLKAVAVIGQNGEQIRVNDLAADDSFLYACTPSGLKRAPLNGSNLSDFRSWQLLSGSEGLPEGPASKIIIWDNSPLVAIGNTLYRRSGAQWLPWYRSEYTFRALSGKNSELLLCEQQQETGQITVLNNNGVPVNVIRDPYWTASPADCIGDNNDFWIANDRYGLSKYAQQKFTPYQPNGPAAVTGGSLCYWNGALWVAPFALPPDGSPRQQPSILPVFSNNSWLNRSVRELPALDSLRDIHVLAADSKNNLLWGGSLGGGLFSLNEKNEVRVFKQNSPLQPPSYAPGEYRVSGLALDPDHNLWVANYGAVSSLHVRKANGDWKSFTPPFPIAGNAIGKLVIDDVNQKWIQLPGQQGLLCFNHGSSVDNPADDQWQWLRAGKGNGNLPVNDVRCLAKDKNNFIWIGTSSGIGIVQCTENLFGSGGCEAVLPVVKQGNFTGYLLQDEVILCITVDGADRKWVGTQNGVWLLSPDGEKTIARFHTANSPLPDNEVREIAIDSRTGEVFFETARGIFSYRGTATEGASVNQDLLVFPNPVPPGYTGTIAIRGLVNNAIVKITEMDGRLVFETRALGGQAIWNGKNYKGETVASGVYLVWISDETQKEKASTKIVFIGKNP